MPSAIDITIDGTVSQGATVVTESAIIPNGTKVRVIKFGGYERGLSNVTGLIALQFGSSGAWTTVRAGGGHVPFEFNVDKTFTGDGIKKFRLVRQNFDAVLSPAKEMVAWLEAVVL